MSKVVEGTAKPKRGRPAKKVKSLPEALEAELQRIAAEILEERSASARSAAAIEVANKLLARCADLLAIAVGGNSRITASILGNRPPPKPTVLPIIHPCVVCGRTGKWQDKSGRGGKPWYCETHAGNAFISAREEATSNGLLNALKQATPIDDESLPA